MATKLDYSTSSNPAIDAYNKARAQAVAQGKSSSSVKKPTALLSPIQPVATPTVTTPSTSVNLNAPFPTANLSTTSLNLQPTIPPTAAAGASQYIQSAAQGMQQQLINEQQQEQARLQSTVNDQTNQIGGIYERLIGQSNRNEEIYKENNVDRLKKTVDKYTNQIESEQVASRHQIEQLQRNNTEGLFGGALQTRANQIERDSLSKQADLAVLQAGASRNYDTAAAIADRKIAAETEQLQTTLDAMKFFYAENKQELTKAQDREYQLRIAQSERALQEETANKQASQAMIIEAMQLGAPESVVRQAQSLYNQGATPEQLVTLLGRYSQVAADQSYKNSQLAMEQSRLNLAREEAARDAANSPGAIAGIADTISTSNDPVTAKRGLAEILASGAISAGTKSKLAPAVEVLNAVDEFASGNLEGQFTGVGFFGKLKEGVKNIFNQKDPEAINNQQNIDAISLKVGQWASGASLTEQQQKQVDNLTPSSYDSDKTVRTKLSGLYNYMLNQAEGNLLTEGVNVNFPTINLFEVYDLYNKATPAEKLLIEEAYPQLK